MKKMERVQATVSGIEAQMLAELSEASGHSISALAARAITGWLQGNWVEQMALYANCSGAGSEDGTEPKP